MTALHFLQIKSLYFKKDTFTTASSDTCPSDAGTALLIEIIASTHAASPSKKVSMIKINSISLPSYSDSP